MQSNLHREGSYFQRMVHRDTGALASTIATYVDAEPEHVLGIRGRTVFQTGDADEAAVLAVSGPPLS